MLAPSPARLKHVGPLHGATGRPRGQTLQKPHVRLVELGLGVSALLALPKAPKTRALPLRAQLVRLRAEGDVEDPLLAEAKAAAEAARLQLEAAKLRAEADEMRQATALAQRKARAVRLLGSEDVPGIGPPGST